MSDDDQEMKSYIDGALKICLWAFASIGFGFVFGGPKMGDAYFWIVLLVVVPCTLEFAVRFCWKQLRARRIRGYEQQDRSR